MIKTAIIFLILANLIYLGITVFQHLTKEERWTAAKKFTVAVICAAIAVTILMLITIIF